MMNIAEHIVKGRAQAAKVFADVLAEYAGTDALIAAVPNGGAPIGFHLSEFLDLPLTFVFCKRIQHPGFTNESIGSVSIDEVALNERSRSIPQGYVQHQIILLRNTLRYKSHEAGNQLEKVSFKGKTVIVTDDFLKTGDTLIASLKSIQKHKPSRIIVAAAFATATGLNEVEAFSDDVHAIQTFYDHSAYEEKLREFARVTDEEVRYLFSKSKSGQPVSTATPASEVR